MKKYIPFIIALFSWSVACGGSQKRTPGRTSTDKRPLSGSDYINEPDVFEEPTGIDGEEPEEIPEDEPAPITFVINNHADSVLTLSMDRGWQAVIYAYMGTPPNARPMVMFPTYCTAPCTAGVDEICPDCPVPTRARDIKAAENHDDIAPGESREVPWDELAFAYENATGTQLGEEVSCRCYSQVPPEPGVYTVKACGLRKTLVARERSKYECTESTMTLPVTEPTIVELNFE